VAVTTSGAAQTTELGNDHAAGLVAPLHWSDVDIIQRGHPAQRGSQAAVGVMSSAEDWSVVSAFKLADSRASPRLDPGPRSSHMMSFTLVYIHAGRWDRSWRDVMRFDRKLCNTISEVRPFSARYWI
jgi:hypothetical protein